MKQTHDFRRVNVSVSLNYTAESPFYQPFDPENYIISVAAKILGSDCQGAASPYTDSIPYELEITLGTLTFSLIRLASTFNEDISLFEIFDLHQETMDAANALFTPDLEDFNRTVKYLFPDASPWDDILLLDGLEIQPFARGQKLGLAVILRAIQDWSSGCSLVVMNPFPLQFEATPRESAYRSSLALGDFPQDRSNATLKLRTYFEQLGFQRIGRSDFYALGLCEERVSAAELKIPSDFVVPLSAFEEHILSGKAYDDQNA